MLCSKRGVDQTKSGISKGDDGDKPEESDHSKLEKHTRTMEPSKSSDPVAVRNRDNAPPPHRSSGFWENSIALFHDYIALQKTASLFIACMEPANLVITNWIGVYVGPIYAEGNSCC